MYLFTLSQSSANFCSANIVPSAIKIYYIHRSSNMKILLFALILNTFYAVINAQHPSPCPEVFQYDTAREEPGKWYGELTLNSEFPLTGVWIRIVLDRKIELLGTTFTDVSTTDNKEYIIRNREYSLVPGQPLKLSFFVKYSPLEPIPSFVSVRLNGRTVCPAKPLVGLSQCPGVFSFNQDKVEENRWFGTLNLDSELELKGIWIRIILDTPAELLGNEFGEIKTTDNISYLIKNRDYVLTPGRPLRLPFWVKFSPLDRKPNVQSVRLNGRTVCGQFADNQNNIILAPHSTRSVLEKPGETVRTTTELDVSQNSYISCGTVIPESLNLIVRGERAFNAQWPWHGAIYLTKSTGLDYICGMSLISERHALTAAHCVIESIATRKLRDVRSMILYFGLINRKDFTASHVQRPLASQLIMHPNYTVSDSDIAVIKFERPVKFTDWVRPVCLWEDEIDMRYIVKQTGTVVGFGVTETGKISNELLFADILVVDTPTCIFSHRDFYSKYTSFNTYCAGNLTQSAVCNGDSGGGMVFKRDGSDIWQIRGIVSTAVRNSETGLCDYNHYAIFTDAAKYRNWIEMALTL